MTGRPLFTAAMSCKANHLQNRLKILAFKILKKFLTTVAKSKTRRERKICYPKEVKSCIEPTVGRVLKISLTFTWTFLASEIAA